MIGATGRGGGTKKKRLIRGDEGLVWSIEGEKRRVNCGQVLKNLL